MRASPMEDPRDNLQKATRDELWAFAKVVGIPEVREPMPADLCREILRSRGHVNIQIPERPLGGIPILGKAPAYEPPATQTVDATAELRRQYEEQLKNPDPGPEPEKMNFTQLRSELKRRGVKFSRTDNYETLKAKLDGKNAA